MTFLNVVQDNLDLVHGYDGQIAGLLGLSRASPTGHKTFLEAMVSQGSLAQPIMSMHLEDDGGSFLLGGVDSQGFVGDTLYYSPVSDPIDWQISLFGLGTIPRGFASQLTSSKPIQKNITPNVDSIPDPDRVLAHIPAILDSGASAILAPLRASEVLHRHLGGYRDIVHPDLWMLPCEGPDMVWWLAEVGIVQPYEALIHKLQDGRCQSLIFESADLDFWVLGDTWLRGLYIAYDMAGQGRIGIASLDDPKGDGPCPDPGRN
ncbi:hypothetical protein DFQ27_009432 [Actinomortierella ambigua]|uniref:Peptidase A1 domain-containing protein n=1 Tax=Actinomortierella ambigua TaxID=1343610 RepID=A0A9P6PR62_9FUNG|nr:hypothetical protein DFQ27_009432 [Actinomortierella ambigua]